ncbi:MAG TPA: ABC transporter ATP-binding protein, partial [Bacteroidales bacterium]|nr:ABC transporter ATP-binding protein [Bacteroidales bacterium]
MDQKKILEVNDLTVVFHHENEITTAIEDVSFSLERGETLGIVGESGSGKSVTALSILRLIPYPEGEIKKGNIFFRDNHGSVSSLLLLTEKQMQRFRGKEVGMIFQEPMTSLNPVLTCGFQVTEAMRWHLKNSRKEARLRALDWFNEVRLPMPEAIFGSYPHQLSGGQKQRVMIAMAMSCNPNLLIADEPTTALDVTVQKTILELMKELQAKHGMSILFITHDLALVSDFADRILVMYKGKVVEEGKTDKLFRSPSHPYTAGLLKCRPPANKRLKTLPTITEFLEPGIRPMQVPEVETAEERKNRHDMIYSRPPILQVKDLETEFPSHFSFFGKADAFVKAVNCVSFDVYPGETLGIVGESGSGKTTLGRSILQLIRGRSGKIIFDGQEIQGLSQKKLRSIRRDLQIIFQDPYSSLNPRLTAGAAIMEPMLVQAQYRGGDERKRRAIELLEMVGLGREHFSRYPHEFSGGQRQRVCIARTLAVQPRLIICDESVSSLDVSIQAQILNLLNKLKSEFGFTYVFISHDLSVVRFMSDRLIVMRNGKIEEIGDADKIYSFPEKEYTKSLLGALPV